MVDVIDVKGLTDEDVKFVVKIIESLRNKKVTPKKKKKENIRLTVHDSNVIGKLTRREIYEDL